MAASMAGRSSTGTTNPVCPSVTIERTPGTSVATTGRPDRPASMRTPGMPSPAGRLGNKLRRVEALMHTGDDVPRVLPTAKMPDVIYEMSRKGLGLAAVTEAGGRVLGIITDGDLRRVMLKEKENVLGLTAADCMTKNPVTIPRSELAASALRAMEEKKITSVLVVDSAGRLEGVLHVHDLWTLQLF